MKKILILLSFCIILSACTDGDDDTFITESEIIGNWELVPILADLGDGSGSYQSATGKTLQFNNQAVVNCNISFCFEQGTQATITGTYDISATSIEVDNCTAIYSFNGPFLEVSHFGIEPCGERYIRVN